MTDLDLISTDDLITALLARFRAAVLIGERQHSNGCKETVFQYEGDEAAAKGLAGLASDILTDELRLKLKPKEEEQEGEPECSP